MDYQNALALADRLQETLSPADADGIHAAFDALVWLDGHQILQRAEAFMADSDLDGIIGDLHGDAIWHRLTMDAFYASMLDALCEKAQEVDASVEHDIASWIEANAPTVALANIAILEAALPHEQAQRTLIEFHQHLDVDRCTREQQRMLETTWADIEARLQAWLDGSGFAAS